MKFIDASEDTWQAAPEGETPAPAANRLLTLAQWQAVRETWPTDVPAGVIVPNDSDIESLEADLPKLGLVVLQFPKWTDGRAYTQARLLRGRYRFKGTVRATGEVLVDMVLLMDRTGFDEAQLRADQVLASAERALGFFPGYYQSDVAHPQQWRAAQPASEARP